MSRTILVTGATGNQGRAVIKALFSTPEGESQFKVVALTRNTESSGAVSLAKEYPGVRLLRGDLDDCDAVFRDANTPIWGVFSVQVFYGKNASLDSEVRQGKALVDASLKHGVQHFVYSSADRANERFADEPTPVPHFASKYAIEQHLKEKTAASGKMQWTILRPTAFMENWKPGFASTGMYTCLNITRSRDLPIWLISCADIGWFAADAFRHPEKYTSSEFSLASDSLSLNQLDELYRRRTGKPTPTTFRFVGSLFLAWAKEINIMLKWLGETPYTVDIEGLKKIHPEMETFEHWLENNGHF